MSSNFRSCCARVNIKMICWYLCTIYIGSLQKGVEYSINLMLVSYLIILDVFIKAVAAIFHQLQSISNHFWSGCILVEKCQEYFPIVQQHLTGQLDCPFLYRCPHIHCRVLCTSVIKACSCCFWSSNELVVTGFTFLTRCWVTRFWLTVGTNIYERGRFGSMMPASVFYELIRRYFSSNR